MTSSHLSKRGDLDLNGEWQMAFSLQGHAVTTFAELQREGEKLYPCVVPGCLETDLVSLGLLPELFQGMNILEVQKYERYHVWYGRSFKAEIPPDGRGEIVFEGIDCFADIYLNGKLLGSANNMLIRHAFAVGDLLREENELLVHIRPATVEAEKCSIPAGLGTQGLNYESLPVRKAPHMYGWDIMPRAVSAGLWRGVRLHFVPAERLKDIYLETTFLAPDHSRAELTLHYQVSLTDIADSQYTLSIEGHCGESRIHLWQPITFMAGRSKLSIDSPLLWWPRGSGNPNLYKVVVRLLKNGVEIDRESIMHGVRVVALKRSSITNEQGSGQFVFEINGEAVFIKGTNWVPMDAFHWRDAQRLPRILPLLLECNCNLVRCWGGNVYEDDAFFDWCDQYGILVWQDFAMACGIYPQEAGFQDQLRTEARQIVRRLRHHACLLLWAGDNECDQSHGWLSGGDPNQNILTRRILPEVLKEEDPNRPYLPSSPYIDSIAYSSGEKFLSENHLWGPRDYYKGKYYTDALCHFASEIGYHGAPDVRSIEQFISPEKLWPPQNNDEWILHSTNPRLDNALFSPPEHRVNLMINQIKVLFGCVPRDIDEFVFASQASQAEAMKFFIEQFRVAKWRRTGIIWWNLIDGWPQFSDAVVDYYFRKKLAFEFIRNSQRDLCIFVQEPEQGWQKIVAVNDTRDEQLVYWKIWDFSENEFVLSGENNLSPNGKAVCGELPFDADQQKCYKIFWETGTERGSNHYLAGRPPFDLNQYRSWLEGIVSFENEAILSPRIPGA